MFKLPSLSIIIEEFKSVINRFPIVLGLSFIGAFLSIFSYEKEYNNVYIFNTLITIIISIPLFISIYLLFEKNNLGNKIKYTIFSIASLFLLSYYFSLPIDYKYFNYLSDSIILFFIYLIGFHLLVSFIPFLKSNNSLSFWEYNNTLFIRISASIFFSILLYTGISIALFSIDTLFEIKIYEKLYFDIGLFIFWIFNTSFFLAGINKDFEIEYIPSIPKYIKSLSQYVLIPIVILYLIIIYLYTGKIIISMNWPKGGVSYLIIACSFIGILANLLIYPLQVEDNNSLLKNFPKFFYISIIPMIIVLFFAVERRVRDYGITENRYLLIIIAFWLLFISVYFLINKFKNIKMIPISLFIVSILISFGPFSIFNVPYRSQFNRLKVILEKNKILVNNKINKITNKIDFYDNKEISAIVDYIVRRDKDKELISLFKNQLSIKDMRKYSKSEKIVNEMGLDFINNYRYTEDKTADNKFYSFATNKKNYILDINGYNSIINFSGYLNFNSINIDNKFIIKLVNNNLELYQDNIIIASINIEEYVNSLKNKFTNTSYNLDAEDLSMIYENEKIKLKIYFNNINGNGNAKKSEVKFISGSILILNKN